VRAVYHVVVRGQVRRAFRLLSEGRSDDLVAGMRPDVRHTFPGGHALGGQRHDRESVRLWVERLHRLFPGLTFEILGMASSGPPWRTVVGVEWRNRANLPDGSRYENSRSHILRLRWGRLTSFHAYLHDAEGSAESLRRLADAGVVEAAAPPIVSPGHPITSATRRGRPRCTEPGSGGGRLHADDPDVAVEQRGEGGQVRDVRREDDRGAWGSDHGGRHGRIDDGHIRRRAETGGGIGVDPGQRDVRGARDPVGSDGGPGGAVPPGFDPDGHGHEDPRATGSCPALGRTLQEGENSPMLGVSDVHQRGDGFIVEDDARRP
jgi:ketosteroid isomerase-like protein